MQVVDGVLLPPTNSKGLKKPPNLGIITSTNYAQACNGAIQVVDGVLVPPTKYYGG